MEKENITMSRYAFERMQAKDERNDRCTSTQTEVNADNGTANYIGRDGDINNGKDSGTNKDKDS